LGERIRREWVGKKGHFVGTKRKKKAERKPRVGGVQGKLLAKKKKNKKSNPQKNNKPKLQGEKNKKGVLPKREFIKRQAELDPR